MKIISEYKISHLNVELNGKKYFIPTYAKDRPAAAVMSNGYRYEEATHKFVESVLEKTNKSIVHGGTFFGDMVPSFADACRETLYAFEPVLENYVLTRRCVQENDIKNVVLYNAAISNETGHAYMQTFDKGHMGGASQITTDDTKKTQLVNTIAIDDLKLKELSIIHLDLENHEPAAIKGAKKTIKRDQPIVIMEDYHNDAGKVLESFGYGYEFIDKLQFGPYNWLNIWANNMYKDIAEISIWKN